MVLLTLARDMLQCFAILFIDRHACFLLLAQQAKYRYTNFSREPNSELKTIAFFKVDIPPFTLASLSALSGLIYHHRTQTLRIREALHNFDQLLQFPLASFGMLI